MAANVSVTIGGQRGDYMTAVAADYRELLALAASPRAEVEAIQELYRQALYAASRTSIELPPGLLYNGGRGRPGDLVVFPHYSLRLNL